jgi:hypothetical protein
VRAVLFRKCVKARISWLRSVDIKLYLQISGLLFDARPTLPVHVRVGPQWQRKDFTRHAIEWVRIPQWLDEIRTHLYRAHPPLASTISAFPYVDRCISSSLQVVDVAPGTYVNTMCSRGSLPWLCQRPCEWLPDVSRRVTVTYGPA